MKRRLVIFPFDTNIPIRNTKLKKELVEPRELDAAFQWLWEGWKLYQAEGLPDFDAADFPAKMKEVMTDFYQQNDILSDFIEECFYIEQGQSIRASVVFDKYKTWAAGDRSQLGRKSFYAELRKRGFPKKHGRSYDVIEGLMEKTCVKV